MRNLDTGAEDLRPGARIGTYQIVRMIGEGGMGLVYEAVHETIGRRVALKVLHAAYVADQTAVARLINEARAVNRVDHPGLVQVYDSGQLAGGRVYILMELLHGETLHARAVARRLDLLAGVRIARQTASALSAVHERGIIHRDLKPENIMVVQDPEAPGGERAKVLDFGIAKLHEQDLGAGVRTRPDVVFGTPAYMSPEQCRDSSKITPRSDVYSLGVLLYWVIMGRVPFDGSAAEIIGKHMLMPAPPIGVELPVGADALPHLVQAMLTKDPEKRPSMNAVASTLEQVELQLAESLIEPSEGEAGQDARSRSYRTLSALRRVTESASQPALAIREPLAQKREGRRLRLFTVLILVGVGLAASAGAATSLLQARRRPVAAVAPLVAESLPTPGTGAVVAAPPPLLSREPAPVADAPCQVRWALRSIPTGAEVLRLADNESLGKTPLEHVLPCGAGTSEVKLVLSGYKVVQLALDHSADQEHDIKLAAAPAGALPRGRQPVRTPSLSKTQRKSNDLHPSIEFEE